jgi:hypothetical protein
MASVKRRLATMMRGTALCVALLGAFAVSAFAQAPASTLVRGLWVWKSPTVLEAPGGAEALRNFCKSEGINEVYVSISGQSEAKEEGQLARMIALMHSANIRVEALLSSTDADEPGKQRETLLEDARIVVQLPGLGATLLQRSFGGGELTRMKKGRDGYVDTLTLSER